MNDNSILKYGLLGLAVIVVFSAIFFLRSVQTGGGSVFGAQKIDQQSNPKFSENLGQGIDLEESEGFKINNRQRSANAPVAERSIVDIRKDIIEVLNASEFTRVFLLAEKKNEFGVTTMLGVNKPSVEEVKKLRGVFAAAKEQVASNQLDQFNEWFTEVERKYDPFGISGEKIIVISIPDDSEKRLSGMSYVTDNFQGEVEKFNAGNKVNFTGKGLKVFGPNEAGDLDRFKKLIVK